jgi:hypothetical protein
MDEALPLQMNKRSKGIKRDRRNPKHRSYNFDDSAKLVQKISTIYAFCRIRGHAIIECPQIDSEVRNGMDGKNCDLMIF